MKKCWNIDWLAVIGALNRAKVAPQQIESTGIGHVVSELNAGHVVEVGDMKLKPIRNGEFRIYDLTNC